MKILTVIQRYHPIIGGSENLTKNLMDFLATNHQITVYTTLADDIQSFWYANSKKVKNISNLPYDVKHFDFLIPTEIKHTSELDKLPVISNHPGPFSPKLWADLILNGKNFDLMFLTSFPYDHILPAYISAKKWNIPILCMPLIHPEHPELFLTSLKLTILNNSDAIITLSKSEKEILIENGIPKEKIIVIPPSIIPFHNIKLELREFRSKYLKNFGGKIVLFIGNKSTMKGIIHLINAMKQIWKKNKEVKLILIGSTSSEFENFFSKLDPKYRNNIIDLGVVSEKEKNEALSICDIFVLPSNSESFGLVYVEAWIHSKPVIGCNLKSIMEVIEHNKNGLLTEFGNVAELEKSITYLLENPKIGKKFGVNGKIKSSIFTSEENMKKFEEICKKVISNFKK